MKNEKKNLLTKEITYIKVVVNDVIDDIDSLIISINFISFMIKFITNALNTKKISVYVDIYIIHFIFCLFNFSIFDFSI